MSASTPAFLRRLTSGAPFLITVIVHVVLGLVAAVVVVQQNSSVEKRFFEPSARGESTAAPQVEHRLQVARRGGASGAAQNPVSANRIFSSAESALQMPAMPDLPSLGAGGFGGFGGQGAGVGLGAGSEMATSLGGGTGLGGRGFMSLSFLGATAQNVNRVVFVVDTSAGIMDLRKGGFRAFTIIREEIMRLVGRLPPSAQFNVILFSDGAGNLNLFGSELLPATSQNKKDFFEWMAPVNTDPNRLGASSAGRRNAWVRKPVPADAGIDPLFLPPHWSHGLRAALEQQADVVFVITSSVGAVYRRADDATIAKRREAVEKRRSELEKQGVDIKGIQAAQARSMDKARREFEEANRRMVAAGKDPIIITDPGQIFSAHVQAVLRRNGITITRDLAGWTDKDGKPIELAGIGMSDVEGATWADFNSYLARLQKAFVPKRAAINLFLFVGPDETAQDPVAILTTVAKRNDGKFQLLTTKRLEELKGDGPAS